jgi:hypothetical protein
MWRWMPTCANAWCTRCQWVVPCAVKYIFVGTPVVFTASAVALAVCKWSDGLRSRSFQDRVWGLVRPTLSARPLLLDSRTQQQCCPAGFGQHCC